MRPLRHLQLREQIIDVAREYLSRHGLTFVDGHVFCTIVEVLRRYDRNDWDEAIETMKRQNPSWTVTSNADRGVG